MLVFGATAVGAFNLSNFSPLFKQYTDIMTVGLKYLSIYLYFFKKTKKNLPA